MTICASWNVDWRGTMCPGPITHLFRAYRNANIGDVIELLATDPVAKRDTEAWTKRSGNEIIAVIDEKDRIRIQIRVVKKDK
jgi:tRNA 2-thiouridine synthesizing protein A